MYAGAVVLQRAALFRLIDIDRKLLDLPGENKQGDQVGNCLLYTSDAADDLLCVDLGGRRINKKKQKEKEKEKQTAQQKKNLKS